MDSRLWKATTMNDDYMNHRRLPPHETYEQDGKLGSPMGHGLWSPRASPLSNKAAMSGQHRRSLSSSDPAQHPPTHDDLSVNLFASSFDSFNEEALRATFDRDPPPLSPMPTAHQASREAGSSTTHHATSNSAEPDGTATTATLGSISPIKLCYSDTVAPSYRMEARREPFEEEDVHWPCDSNGSAQSPVSNPFYVIRFAAGALTQIKYKLPCLHEAGEIPVHMNSYGQIRQYKPSGRNAIPSVDTKIATMRVESAICAFGGTLQERRFHHPESIFRLKDGTFKSKGRRLYEQKFLHRFVLSGNKISWDFEEEPPIVIPTDDERDDTASSTLFQGQKDTKSMTSSTFVSPGTVSCEQNTLNSSETLMVDSNNNKMKYKCKMCGQLKNNHNCPYRQQLQRSIGVMVYPAVNSFTAFEPGTIAPPLTKMNNFVSYDSDQNGSVHRLTYAPSNPSTVTPDAFAATNVGFFHSPQSSLSNHSEEVATPAQNQVAMEQGDEINYEKRASRKREREQLEVTSTTAEVQEKDSLAKRALFLTTVNLKPEHFRSVTQTAHEDNPTAYQYASIPLTFAERKRLSDTLFVLSKEIPTMTSSCAGILREARENNEWDMAVAELLTQLVVGLFCTEEDLRLEGLQRYLLALGISC